MSALEHVYFKLPYELRRKIAKTAFPSKYSALQNLRVRLPDAADSASLRPFVEHRCIFIHIPKTAGVSVNAGLFGCNTGYHRDDSGVSNDL